AGNPRMQNPRRQQPEHELAAIGVHGVTGVVSTLVARHDREMRCQEVDDLSLALVSPLRAEHGDVHTCSILLVFMILLDGESLRLDDIVAIADAYAPVALAPAAAARIDASRAVVDRKATGDEAVYGINTGFGALAETRIPRDALGALQQNLLRSHAAGVGEPLPERTVRASMALRANVLAKGFSGIRRSTLDLLIAMLNRRVHPRVPSRGSVGASGDLAPLAHLALVVIGEGEATVEAGGSGE